MELLDRAWTQYTYMYTGSEDREEFYGILEVFGRHLFRFSFIHVRLHRYVHIEAQ